jgi:hypothetical protein
LGFLCLGLSPYVSDVFSLGGRLGFHSERPRSLRETCTALEIMQTVASRLSNPKQGFCRVWVFPCLTASSFTGSLPAPEDRISTREAFRVPLDQAIRCSKSSYRVCAMPARETEKLIRSRCFQFRGVSSTSSVAEIEAITSSVFADVSIQSPRSSISATWSLMIKGYSSMGIQPQPQRRRNTGVETGVEASTHR